MYFKGLWFIFPHVANYTAKNVSAFTYLLNGKKLHLKNHDIQSGMLW